jgi:hypothetical protein
MTNEKPAKIVVEKKTANLGSINFIRSAAGMYYSGNVYTMPGKIISVTAGNWVQLAEDMYITPNIIDGNKIFFTSNKPSFTNTVLEINIVYIQEG